MKRMINTSELSPGNIRRIIHRKLAEAMCKELGYMFESERVDRISDESMKMMDAGVDIPNALVDALHDELILYGDPNAPAVKTEGILRQK